MAYHGTSRKALRLKDYDYSKPGFYFVTICSYMQFSLFGEINNDILGLNENGLIIDCFWNKIPNKFPNIQLDEYVIMPNHIHGIIQIISPVGADMEVRPYHDGPKGCDNPTDYVSSIPEIIQWYKSITTKEYEKYIHALAPGFPQVKLWQRNYYERIIRDENELNNVRAYIINNPMNWNTDKENTLSSAP